jgi:hypothetical protein
MITWSYHFEQLDTPMSYYTNLIILLIVLGMLSVGMMRLGHNCARIS